MSRPYIYMLPEKPPPPEKVAEAKENVVSALYDYLEDYEPEKWVASKSGLMGPAGKLLSAVTSGRFENRDAIIGFVVNIHANTSRRELGPTSLGRLKEAVDGMAKLRQLVSDRMWPQTLREIDYAVFSKQYSRVSQSIRGRGGEDQK